jgi:hypothetical protein
MPLILKIFSQEAEEFKSENEEITSAIKKVSYHKPIPQNLTLPLPGF